MKREETAKKSGRIFFQTLNYIADYLDVGARLASGDVTLS